MVIGDDLSTECITRMVKQNAAHKVTEVGAVDNVEVQYSNVFDSAVL
jgi:hypothetical protein